jgi:cell division protein FtsB
MTRKRRKQSRKKKQQKKQSQGDIFPAPLAAILLLAAVLSLTYVWLCGRCDALGRDIKALEQECEEIRRRRLNEEYKWANMRSPRNIERALREHNLDMDWPDRRCIITLSSAFCEMDTNGKTRSKDSWDSLRVAMND